MIKSGVDLVAFLIFLAGALSVLWGFGLSFSKEAMTGEWKGYAVVVAHAALGAATVYVAATLRSWQ